MTERINSNLLKHLIDENAVSGPRVESINNSGLGRIYRILSGGAPFLGGERYLLFGTEMHYRCLERKKGKWKPVDATEASAMEGGVKSLHRCKLFLESLPGAIVEKTVHKPNAFGIHAMHGTLDLRKILKRKGKTVRRIIDLKTTSAKTEEEFIKKALDLRYPRQLMVYDEIAPEEVDISEGYIIGISKHNQGTIHRPDYPHWVFDINNYEKEQKKALQEAKFLLEFYHQFGIPRSKFKGDDDNSNILRTGESFTGSGPNSKQESRPSGRKLRRVY